MGALGSLASGETVYSPGGPSSTLQPCEQATSAVRGSAAVRGPVGASMNPSFTEVSIMTITSPIRSFVRTLTRRQKPVAVHPDAVFEPRLTLPRRIDDPVSAARTAHDLLHHWKEDVTLVLYLDDRHRFVGHCIVAVGRVQAARLSARPVLFGAQVCRASACILVRYHRWERLSASEAENRSYRAIAAATGRHGLPVVDHLVVTGDGAFSSAHHARS